jgi:hypothetical protein
LTNQSTWTFAQQTCYYDIAVTNDLSLGQASQDAANTIVEVHNAQRSPPEFNSGLPLVLIVNGSIDITLNFTAVSPYSSTLLYTLLKGPSNAIFDNHTALFNWQTPSSMDNDAVVRVSAQDTRYGLLSTYELAVRIINTTITTTQSITSVTSRVPLATTSCGDNVSISWIFVILNILGTIYSFNYHI